jgi:tetratricopeptide (TPR) repeat protein
VNEKWTEATKYFMDAIALEVDPRKKAADYLRLSSIQQKLGQAPAAKQSALKAIALNKEDGRGYLVIAGLYASAAGSCGDNVFEKNAVYWAAIDYASKAKSIDASLTKQADALIANFKKGIPDKSIAFQFNKKDGDRYTIGCWINETVTVRFY